MTDTYYGSAGRQPRPAARIICDNAARHHDLEYLARECGLTTCADEIDPLAPPAAREIAAAECLLIDFPSISDRPQSELNNLSSYIKTSGADALVWTDMDALDMAYAELPARNCHFLVDPNPAEAMLLLTGATTRGIMDQLHDKARDDGYQELHKISSDLADVVRTLARYAGAEEAGGGSAAMTGVPRSSVSDAPVSFRPASPSAMQPLVPAASNSELTAGQLREIIQLRRMRDRFFASDLFADPAWDILLDLMAARLEAKKVSVSSLCIAASVPPTTALRWITTMTDRGLLVRNQDPDDARRVFLDLSDDAAEKIAAYFHKASQISRHAI